MDNHPISWYCREARRFNELLREGEHRSDYKLIRAADALELRLANSVLAPPVILFRGVDWDYARTLCGKKVGDTLFDPGFMSTSRSLAKARRFCAVPPGGVVLAITSAYPVRGLDVSAFSQFDEEEVVLAPGTRLRIVGLNPDARLIETEVLHGEDE